MWRSLEHHGFSWSGVGYGRGLPGSLSLLGGCTGMIRDDDVADDVDDNDDAGGDRDVDRDGDDTYIVP